MYLTEERLRDVAVRQTVRHTHRWTDRQTDMQTDRQIHRLYVYLTEERLREAAVVKSELEAEVTKSRSETANLRDALHKMNVTSDGLSQDKADLNKVIMKVRHFLSDHFFLLV